MRSIQLPGRDTQTTLIKIGRDVINIFQDCQKLHTVVAPAALVDFTVSYDGGANSWKMWCLCETGALYCLSEEQVMQASIVPVEQNQEIFTDLLGPTTALPLSSSSEPVSRLTQSHVVLTNDMPVLAVCVYDNYVLVLSYDHGGYYTSLYKQRSLLLHAPNGESAVGSVFFPYTQYPMTGNTDENRPTASLHFVFADLLEHEPNPNSQCLKISDELFKALFTSDMALMNSAVILFSPPNGSVYFTAAKLGSKQDQAASSWRILCHTSQRVSSIHSITVPTRHRTDDTTDELYNGLLLCAEDGQCTLISQHREKGVWYKSCLISGPLVVSDCCSDQIFHSTGKEVLETTLSLTYRGEELVLSAARRPKFVNCGNVQELKCLNDPGHIHGCCDSLLCRLGDNKVKVIKFADTQLSAVCSDNPGRRIRNLLVCIENVSRKRSNMSLASKKINLWLSQLSIASFLIQLSLSKNKFQPIMCVVTVKQGSSALSSLRSNLSCILTNQGAFQLSSDWSVLVVTTAFTGIHLNEKCVNLDQGLKEKESIELILPLRTEEIFKYPLKVQVFMCLKTDSLSEKDMTSISSQWKHESLSIKIWEQFLDVFHFLKLSTDLFKLENRTSIPVESTLWKLAELRPVTHHMEVKNENSSELVTIKIELELPDQMENSNQKKKELALLKLLLKDSQISSDQICESHLSLVSLTGEWRVQLGVTARGRRGEITATGPVAFAAAIRQAILRKLELPKEKKTNAFVPTVETGQGLLVQIELLKKQLQILGKHPSPKSDTEYSSRRHELGQFYEKLRHPSCTLAPSTGK